MKSKNTFKPQDFKVELVDSKPKMPTWMLGIEKHNGGETIDGVKGLAVIVGFIAFVYGLFYFIGG